MSVPTQNAACAAPARCVACKFRSDTTAAVSWCMWHATAAVARHGARRRRRKRIGVRRHLGFHTRHWISGSLGRTFLLLRGRKGEEEGEWEVGGVAGAARGGAGAEPTAGGWRNDGGCVRVSPAAAGRAEGGRGEGGGVEGWRAAWRRGPTSARRPKIAGVPAGPRPGTRAENWWGLQLPARSLGPGSVRGQARVARVQGQARVQGRSGLGFRPPPPPLGSRV